VVIVFANRIEDRRFEYRQGVMFLGLLHCNAVLCNSLRIVIMCIEVKEMSKIIFKAIIFKLK
jgi:hypothetical protein